MKNIKSIMNSEIHSRLSKSLKKSLNTMNVSVTQSQTNEAVSNMFGFSSFHAATSFYSKENSTEGVLSGSYLVSFDRKREDYFSHVENTKVNILFRGFSGKHFNFYELSKVIDFFEINFNEKGYQKFDDFLESSLSFLNGVDKEEFLNTMPHEIFSHGENSKLFQDLFKNEELIQAFDKVFETYFKESSKFEIYSEEIKEFNAFSSFKITEISESEADFLEQKQLVNKVIYKD